VLVLGWTLNVVSTVWTGSVDIETGLVGRETSCRKSEHEDDHDRGPSDLPILVLQQCRDLTP
jgi:hypothetical protein